MTDASNAQTSSSSKTNPPSEELCDEKLETETSEPPHKRIKRIDSMEMIQSDKKGKARATVSKGTPLFFQYTHRNTQRLFKDVKTMRVF